VQTAASPDNLRGIGVRNAKELREDAAKFRRVAERVTPRGRVTSNLHLRALAAQFEKEADALELAAGSPKKGAHG
jgi:hypothetical protein